MKDYDQILAEREDREGELENRRADFYFSIYGPDWDLHLPSAPTADNSKSP